jgi:hypothetical protein
MISNEIKHVAIFISSLHRTPKVVLKECIKHTLDSYIQTYNETLTEAQNYLLTRNPIKVLKNITKEQKKEEKKHEQTIRRTINTNNNTNNSIK